MTDIYRRLRHLQQCRASSACAAGEEKVTLLLHSRLSRQSKLTQSGFIIRPCTGAVNRAERHKVSINESDFCHAAVKSPGQQAEMLTWLPCDVSLMMICVCLIFPQPTSAGAPEKDQRSGTRTFRSWRSNPNIPTVRRR